MACLSRTLVTLKAISNNLHRSGPGEKLYEELLIDAESEPTAHPLIFRAKERALDPEYLWPKLHALEVAINQQDDSAALAILSALVPEWHSKHHKNITCETALK